jgi:hypothetical protein
LCEQALVGGCRLPLLADDQVPAIGSCESGSCDEVVSVVQLLSDRREPPGALEQLASGLADRQDGDSECLDGSLQPDGQGLSGTEDEDAVAVLRVAGGNRRGEVRLARSSGAVQNRPLGDGKAACRIALLLGQPQRLLALTEDRGILNLPVTSASSSGGWRSRPWPSRPRAFCSSRPRC